MLAAEEPLAERTKQDEAKEEVKKLLHAPCVLAQWRVLSPCRRSYSGNVLYQPEDALQLGQVSNFQGKLQGCVNVPASGPGGGDIYFFSRQHVGNIAQQSLSIQRFDFNIDLITRLLGHAPVRGDKPLGTFFT